ncbi:3-methylornithyl-N6-L-lysine dehydrogenase PylD [Parasporobacterium paucivorans]|uniref:Pyrrolysine biosynthesis protein PylD n=1 Tax=Parasporobacterium paucivorans DSM 15970 TaxID=1122934 RepID=A0A1M6IHU4_9FIRM|nr:3-methylornithyl-N6-L-lysine dehydrogenase PylD [Parasporobacterium paucivorans]SHJ33999.1 pyrrolysine biosynthesis protein PylD [Parasporobacterium paucivorans DSM 15970]
MTRLLESDIDVIERQLQTYEELFIRQTGHTMEAIARKAAGISGKVKRRKAGVVPVTSGLGVISGFSRTVGAILHHCQVETLVTEETDVAGLQQAYLSGCGMAFLADDKVCAAFGIGQKAHSDNGEATGRGYAAALVEAMKTRGIDPAGEAILIIGAGPVGQAAAGYIAEQKASPVICDLDVDKAARLAAGLEDAVFLSAPAPLREYRYLIDASTSPDLIKEEDVTEETIVAAPGMPCGATEEAGRKATVIHNPLELGIITMYFDCMKQLEE